jgi:outer membrane biosynthesis protein TonB
MMQGQLSEQELNRYIAGMQRAVEEQWKVPLEMMDAVQPALVELSLSRKGEVVKLSILETSGSDMLDETLKKAIYAAAPFQLPNRQYILFKTNKIRFFPLK